MRTPKASDLVEGKLDELNNQLSARMGAETIIFRSHMNFGVDDQIKNYVEELKLRNTTKDKLCVLLETWGGYVEVVERIYVVFRKHYNEVIFIVPNFAYSAGTVLVLSGDEIYMDYYSVLGPIDPQFEAEDGRSWYSGIGYLHKFDELVQVINDAKNTGKTVNAELAYLVKRFDPAKLFQIEQARDHSQKLLEEWLPKHKWKNWTKTASTGKTVDPTYKAARAKDIAKILSEPKRWHSHGRGITRQDLEAEEIKLKINNLDADQALNTIVRQYYDLFIDYCGKQGLENAIHGNCGVKPI